MSEYVFTWPKGPEEVVITGSFDNWTGSTPLVKQPSGDFSLTMPLPPSDDDKFVFKFIVDGEWIVSDKFEKDYSSGPENNVIFLSKIANSSDSNTWIPESGLSAQTKKSKVQPAPGSNKKGKKKKVKVKKRIRRDKKTGEQVVVSEERTELNSDGEEESEEVSTTATSKETTPFPPQTATTDPAEENTAPVPAVLPSKENQQITLGEPGIAIVQNPNEIKEFREIRDVDAAELNEQLNSELKAKQDRASAVEPVTPVVDANTPDRASESIVESADQGEPAAVEETVAPSEPAAIDEIPAPAESAAESAAAAATVEETVAQTEPTTVEETGIITSAEQEAELIQRTLDPKVGEAELLVVEADIPKEDIPEVQDQIEKVADDAIKANNKIADTVTDDLKKTSETANKTVAAAAAKKPVAQKAPAKEEKKKKKGLFSKLKKLFN